MEYRIKEKRFAGHSHFKVQYKGEDMFFWHTFKEAGYSGVYDTHFSSIEEAKQFIERDKENRKNNKYIGEFIHPV